MASTNTQSVLLPGSLYLQAGDEILVPVSYQVSGEDGSLELSGLGGVVLFDPAQLEFLGYEAAFSTDLFQAPSNAYTEEELVDALTKAGKSVAADLDGVPDTLAGVPFAYLSGADAAFDDDPGTEWDGNPNWPGSDATEALSDSGLKLFSLRFTALEGFSGSPLTTVVTTTAGNYAGAGDSTSVILNTPSSITGDLGGSGSLDSRRRPLDPARGSRDVLLTISLPSPLPPLVPPPTTAGGEDAAAQLDRQGQGRRRPRKAHRFRDNKS
jgi:hypothetical protein